MNKQLNPVAQDFINEIEKFSKHPLNRKAEIITIYGAAINSNQVDLFRELCFTAKYLLGMMRVLHEGGNNPQVNSLDYIKKDFSKNVEKAIGQIRQIMTDSDESENKYFEEEFFPRSHSALSNLNELLADLESAKLYLNYLKRETKN